MLLDGQSDHSPTSPPAGGCATRVLVEFDDVRMCATSIAARTRFCSAARRAMPDASRPSPGCTG